ncbi:hypothetical protein [Streptomyces albipurpureus]|uniref:Calcium-binding protein n=1 Tax=Streptomyces albipurpureus TaxID=2897419 RepID=A0ABT0UYQ3_9ACTN|nr:hypothetical protein [Streptomyces sp. CWNU-1]MCM2393557.1 hypothetical protein [Streptomyces sp. CWNU-1]
MYGHGGSDDISFTDATLGLIVRAGLGADTITFRNANWETGATVVYGDGGDDTLTSDTTVSGARFYAGAGSDRIAITGYDEDAGIHHAEIHGGSGIIGDLLDGDDEITITAGRNPSDVAAAVAMDSRVTGGPGNDAIRVRGGDNDSPSQEGTGIADDAMVEGGLGRDTIEVTGGISGPPEDRRESDPIRYGHVFGDDSTSDLLGNRDHIIIGTGRPGSIACLGDLGVAPACALGADVEGQGGDDTIKFRAIPWASRVLGGLGADRITTPANRQSTLDGGTEGDILTVNGTNLNGTLDGGAGTDTLTVNGTSTHGSILDGGEGADTAAVTGDNNDYSTVRGGAGNGDLTVDGTNDYMVNGEAGSTPARSAPATRPSTARTEPAGGRMRTCPGPEPTSPRRARFPDNRHDAPMPVRRAAGPGTSGCRHQTISPPARPYGCRTEAVTGACVLGGTLNERGYVA